MTPRPGQIAAEVAIDQPQLRDESRPAFQAIVSELRAKLQVTGGKSQITASAHNSRTP
jgi:hypothetical protein